MKLIDTISDREYSLSDLRNEWEAFHAEDPLNHEQTFTAELYAILMATVNGRNDCGVVGLTVRETCDYIIRIHHAIKEG